MCINVPPVPYPTSTSLLYPISSPSLTKSSYVRPFFGHKLWGLTIHTSHVGKIEAFCLFYVCCQTFERKSSFVSLFKEMWQEDRVWLRDGHRKRCIILPFHWIPKVMHVSDSSLSSTRKWCHRTFHPTLFHPQTSHRMSLMTQRFQPGGSTVLYDVRGPMATQNFGENSL